MKKEKKIKLFVNESQLADAKTALQSKGVKFWNKSQHFQFDGATAIICIIGVLVLVALTFAAV
jgi:hypothetical protein